MTQPLLALTSGFVRTEQAEMVSQPPPVPSLTPDRPPAPSEHYLSLGAGWFISPFSWDVCLENDHWWAYMPQVCSSSMQELHLVPGIEVHLVEDPIRVHVSTFVPRSSHVLHLASLIFQGWIWPGLFFFWFRSSQSFSLLLVLTPQSHSEKELAVPLFRT